MLISSSLTLAVTFTLSCLFACFVSVFLTLPYLPSLSLTFLPSLSLTFPPSPLPSLTLPHLPSLSLTFPHSPLLSLTLPHLPSPISPFRLLFQSLIHPHPPHSSISTPRRSFILPYSRPSFSFLFPLSLLPPSVLQSPPFPPPPPLIAWLAAHRYTAHSHTWKTCS